MSGLLAFEIFTTPAGAIGIGLLAALMVVFWDWRVAIPALILTQWGVSSLLVQRFNMPVEWGGVFLFLAIMSGMLLALSALQVNWNRHVPRSGIMPLRILVVGMAYLLISSQTLRLPIPLIDDTTVTLFTWLALVALLLLLLGDSPLHTGLGLSLWMVPVHAFSTILLPNPTLIVVVGTAQLIMVLACSYLMLPASAPGLLKRLERRDGHRAIPADMGTPQAIATGENAGSGQQTSRPTWRQRLRIAGSGDPR